MGLYPSVCLDEGCYGDYTHKPSKKLVPMIPAHNLNSSFSQAGQYQDLEEIVFADFSDPFVAKSATELGDYCSDTFIKDLTGKEAISIELQPSIESKGKYIEDSTSDEDFPVSKSDHRFEVDRSDDLNLDLGTLENDTENAPIVSDRVQLHPLLIQSPTSNRDGIVTRNFFESVSYDPMVEAAKSLRQAIETRKYDEVQSLQRDFHIPVAHIKLEEGQSPLHVAVLTGDTLMVQLLLNLGADVNVLDANGRTPIQLANETGNYDVIEVLLGYEPSARASNSTITVVDDSMKTVSLINQERASESSPPRRFGLELQEMIIAIDRQDQESIISQLTTSAADYNGSSDNDKLSVLSTSYSEDPSRRHDATRKPKGINRRIRKAASRIMSIVAPSQYPKSQQIPRNS